ncbi:D-psicose/D-tagatose/L-ribulose 3-epimerase [Micromonospora citrea]|uniref:D-psicose/D-tagatose/L-ribulose 3-epimerase n=1 Tax=Micromonospora citrea TaxID=47855 RepID=A0A1C6UI51_9ACTN|nr:sugar phosphate isomerase/epimerase family protein [Micromonospora citrea]SCL53775.1 D-psicose/D-tagatose/L-ribulose 3-epimerase [Micromonospora citrea]
MRIGINTWAWVAPLTDDALARLAPRIRAWGFDAVELPVQAPGDWDAASAGGLLAGLGLAPAVCAGLLPEHDLLADDGEVVRRTTDFVRHCVALAGRVGAAVVAGPLYAPAGRTWLLDADARRAAVARLRDRLRPLADEAAERGVTIALEPLNRFETSLVNTVEQALEAVDGIVGLGLALDTFHMNIEERDLPAAIRAAGDRLAHVQVCGNDRGAPGGDHLDWPAMLDALADIGYAGQVSIESFTAPALAVPMSVWRPLATGPDALAVEGLAFLRELSAARAGNFRP